MGSGRACTGYQKVENPEARAKFEKAWGLPEGKLPAEPGFADRSAPRREGGKIKAFYNFGEDPLQTEPDSADMKGDAGEPELLISQDIFMTQTTALADVVFPGTSWGEHDGVFSASDRTFPALYGRRAAKGECKHDWQIFSELSTRMGYPMHYEDTQEIWDGCARCVPELLRRHLREDGRRGPCPVADSDAGMPGHSDALQERAVQHR